MRGRVKLLLKIVAVLLILIMGLAGGTIWYVNAHKRELLRDIIAQLNKRINGHIEVAEIEPELLLGFPSLYLSLQQVRVSDSTATGTQRDLLKAAKIEVSAEFFSILNGKPDIRKIHISDGNVYMFADSNGVSNVSRLWKKDQGSPGLMKPEFKEIACTNMRLVFENKARQKYFDLNIKSMRASIKTKDSMWQAKTNLAIVVNELALNTSNGSFLKGKKVNGQLMIDFNPSDATVTISGKEMAIDADKLQMNMCIITRNQPSVFVLDIRTDGILWQHATALLSPNIAGKLNTVKADKPMALKAQIKGRMVYLDTPVVNVQFSTKDNTLTLPGAVLSSCTFDGQYTNRADSIGRCNDENSMVSLRAFHGSWQEIPFDLNGVQVVNFLHPNIAANASTKFAGVKLNKIYNAGNLKVADGLVAMNMQYRGGLPGDESFAPVIKCSVALRGIGLSDQQGAPIVQHTDAEIVTEGNDLVVRDVRLGIGNSRLNGTGRLANFMTVVKGGSKPEVSLDIHSSKLYADQLMATLQKVKATKTTSGKTNRPTNAASVKLGVHVDTLLYEQLAMTGLVVALKAENEQIVVDNASAFISGGKVSVKGRLSEMGRVPHIATDIELQEINMQQLFRLFNNFGQKALSHKNLSGRLTARASLQCNMNANNAINTESVTGKVVYTLQEASLIDFDPLKTIGRTIFRNRDMTRVKIGEVKHEFEIKGDKLLLKPLHITTSALNMDVDGVFGIIKGTDLNIAVPLRNPKNDEAELNDSIKIRRTSKGIVLHFKATDDANGKLKIAWVMKNEIESKLQKTGAEIKHQWNNVKNIFRRRKEK